MFLLDRPTSKPLGVVKSAYTTPPPSLPPLPTLSLAIPDLTRSGLKPRLSMRNSSSPASFGS